MSILIIGADRIATIRQKLEDWGATQIIHWDARNKSVVRNQIPEDVELVIFFTDFLHHSAAKKLKTKVKDRGLKALYCRRAWSEVGNALPRLCEECNINCSYN